jgi:HlyD family secretion protein
MSGQATISTETHDKALIVPLQAVTVRTEKQLAASKDKGKKEDGPPAPEPDGTAAKKATREPMQKVIFVVEDGKARVRRVETGLASENDIELVSGVKEGEVIVEGPYKLLSRDLADGKAVKTDKPEKEMEKAGPKVSGDAKAKKEASGS